VHRAVGVVAVTLALGLLPACVKKKAEEKASAGSADGSAAVSAGPVTNVDEMLKRSFDVLGDEYFAADLDIDYVRADGTLDAAYGELTIETGKRPRPKPPKPADDPNRPVGAPEPHDNSQHEEMMVMVMAKCPHITWKNGAIDVQREASCSMFRSHMLKRPRCTIAGILAAARDAGAPQNALAKISFEVGFGDEAVQTWRFSIDDNPRDIHFRHEGKDDCEAIVEKP